MMARHGLAEWPARQSPADVAHAEVTFVAARR
jgi:hypothetical protein